MIIMLYDEKCLELARYFYQNMPEEKLAELASLLQVTVEEFAPPDTEEEKRGAPSGPRNGLDEVRQYLKPKEVGQMVVSGVHPHVPEPDSLWQPQRCRCGGTIRTQLMGALICGECGRTP